MRQCLIDMDGVIADFVGAISLAHNRPNPYLKPEAQGIWDMELLWGISAAEFYRPSDCREFWVSMPKTPEADQIVELALASFGLANTAILTAPSSFEGCIPGKRAWIERYYPTLKSQMIFGSAKEFLAGPNRWLLDDRDKNVDAFQKAGGHGVLVPRPWNRGHLESGNVIGVLFEAIAAS